MLVSSDGLSENQHLHSLRSGRPELGGKVILLGMYGLAPNTTVMIQDFSQPIQLCFAFMGDEGTGIFKIDLRITAPNGTLFDAPSVQGEIKPGTRGTNVFMGFFGVLPGPGEYSAQLLVDNHPVYDTKFRLAQAPRPANVASVPRN